MKNILFYYPANNRTVAIESLITKFKEQGNNVMLLTQSPEGDLHNELRTYAIPSFGHKVNKKISFFYYLNHLFFLIRFCQKNKVEIVYSHLQQANIISVFAQYVVRAKFYICRHHSNRIGLDYNSNQALFDDIINKLSKIIIVPSQKVYHQLTVVEKVNPKKIKFIHYGYDFSKYPKPSAITVEEIKNQYKATLLLVKIARMVPGKRYQLLLEVLRDLIIDEKLDIKLIAISGGPLMEVLQKFILENRLEKHIFLIGNRSNVMDYMEAADVIITLSETEASNNVVKEAALLKKCVLVCNDVGDFDEYIEQNYSGLLLNKEHPQEELKKYLRAIYLKKIDTHQLGDHLHDKVYSLFSLDNVIGLYAEFNSYNN